VRVDGGVFAGWNVPLEYDPLLAKLSVWAETREMATARMRRAVGEYRILGITTNLGLYAHLMESDDWVSGNLHTGFLDSFIDHYRRRESNAEATLAAVLAVAQQSAKAPAPQAKANGTQSAIWQSQGRRGLLR
jgi:acetyl-CoA carboxylase biotin carboxylase subunit